MLKAFRLHFRNPKHAGYNSWSREATLQTQQSKQKSIDKCTNRDSSIIMMKGCGTAEVAKKIGVAKLTLLSVALCRRLGREPKLRQRWRSQFSTLVTRFGC